VPCAACCTGLKALCALRHGYCNGLTDQAKTFGLLAEGSDQLRWWMPLRHLPAPLKERGGMYPTLLAPRGLHWSASAIFCYNRYSYPYSGEREGALCCVLQWTWKQCAAHHSPCWCAAKCALFPLPSQPTGSRSQPASSRQQCLLCTAQSRPLA